MAEHADNKTLHANKRIGAYAKTALGVLGAIAGIAAIVAFPGLAVVAGEFARHSRGRRRYSAYTMRKTLKRLHRRGYVRVVEKGDELFMQLTPEGKRVLEKVRLQTFTIPVPKQWDGFWRFVAFDIPEEKHHTRALFRMKLRELGFAQLQKSLLAHPYPCEREIALVSEQLGVSSFVHCILAKSFNGDKKLQNRFKLQGN